MKLRLNRFRQTKTCTIGRLYADGKFLCCTLEDVVRPKKIKHQTAIPTGIYQVIINHSVRFKKLMPLLVNVPNFEGIRIHAGNNHSNTSGCILVGNSWGEESIFQSQSAFKKVYNLLTEKLKTQVVTIEICNNFEEVREPE